MKNAHEIVEKNVGLLTILILVAISFGAMVEITPLMFQQQTMKPVDGLEPYTALEMEGRDIYIREGCHVCHSQQIRPLVAEVERYGPYSRAGEFAYDRPFLWGSKRTGPDLHRVGGKYTDIWHEVHLLNPRSVVPESIMPAYPWLFERTASQAGNIEKKMKALKTLGHPYTAEEIANASLALEGLREIDALVRYLQMLGSSYDENMDEIEMEGM